MKKSFLFLIILVAAVLVGVSGCLGGDDADSDNNSTIISEPPVSETNNSSNQSNATIITTFNGSVVTVSPLPNGFTHLATRSVNANSEKIGISDPIIGYRNMLTYDNSNVYLSVFKCSGNKTADDYIQEMIASHAAKYGGDSTISTVQINGHDATRFEATVQETPQEGRYMLAWTNWTGDVYDDSYLVVVYGQTNYSVIKELAEASNL
ncbi:hypothetical protein LJC08_02045 [Methanimicrococcus sp. OttesenSCG-928-J09]|nr:hypothetical protein [Methanimicrococcus sp. OttesenSCG-928-J09]